MNIDILEQLVPNVLTMITQLAATGVIFIMYKKFLHAPVLEYLDARKLKREEDLALAALAKDEARDLQYKTKKDYEQAQKDLTKLRENMLRDAELEKERLLADAKVEIESLKERNDQILENERRRLYKEVNQHLLEVASDINKKVLADYNFSDDEMLSALEKEMVNNDYQHWNVR